MYMISQVHAVFVFTFETKKGEADPSKTSVPTYKTALRHIAQDRNHNNHHLKNLTSQMARMLYKK
jgi:hypothetical protein